MAHTTRSPAYHQAKARQFAEWLEAQATNAEQYAGDLRNLLCGLIAFHLAAAARLRELERAGDEVMSRKPDVLTIN